MIIDLPPFFWRALLGGVGVALVCGPLGAILVWRRMAYFGDALSHAGLLGVTLGMVFHLSPLVGVVVVSIVFSILLMGLSHRAWLATDTLLGILAHTALALGMISLVYVQGTQVDVLGYLFGDVLTLSWMEVIQIYGVAIVVFMVLSVLWRKVLLITVHEELAQAEGVPVYWVKLSYVLLLALVVALSIKIVGMLLITALLVIPVAAARPLSRSPEQLVCLASSLGVLGVALGLCWSYQADVPSGPAMVCVLAGLFFLSVFFSLCRTKIS